MHSEQWIDDLLKDLAGQSLDRHLRVWPQAGGKIRRDNRVYLNFSSNDYLDFANRLEVKEGVIRAVKKWGAGSAASRLMSGTLTCHEQLEARIARFKGYPAALVFGSGWLANAGMIPALVDREDSIFADKLIHASILDACGLSRARLRRFNHNDPDHLAQVLKAAPEAGKRLIVTESVFSMDGDVAPLERIAKIAGAYDAMLMVDEAHSTGVFGPGGSGLIRQLKLEKQVNISMGTLSKALGGYGGFVASSIRVHDLFVNRARSFIYTTAPPPAVIGAALAALDVLEKNPGLGAQLLEHAAFFRERLQAQGLNTLASASQIIPVLVGDSAQALSLSRKLMEQGIVAVAVRPPTVPAGTARLRLSVTLAHSREDLARAAVIIGECAGL